MSKKKDGRVISLSNASRELNISRQALRAGVFKSFYDNTKGFRIDDAIAFQANGFLVVELRTQQRYFLTTHKYGSVFGQYLSSLNVFSSPKTYITTTLSSDRFGGEKILKRWDEIVKVHFPAFIEANNLTGLAKQWEEDYGVSLTLREGE